MCTELETLIAQMDELESKIELCKKEVEEGRQRRIAILKGNILKQKQLLDKLAEEMGCST